MVEFKTLSKEDQKIICELLDKQFKGEEFTNSDTETLSIDGCKYMIDALKSHLNGLGYKLEE